MAVALPGTINGAAESDVHSQLLRQPVGLVFSPAPPPFYIHFLQGDNVRIEAPDNAADAAGSQFAIEADATVNVVSHDAQPLDRGVWRLRLPSNLAGFITHRALDCLDGRHGPQIMLCTHCALV